MKPVLAVLADAFARSLRAVGHLARSSIPSTHVDEVGEGSYDPVKLVENARIDLIINPRSGGRAGGDGRLIRMAAALSDIASVGTVTGGLAIARSTETSNSHPSSVTSLQDHRRTIGAS